MCIRDSFRSTSVVGLMTFLSRIMGLIRDICFARLFGAFPIMDAFFVAFKIPNSFRRFFAEGAFSRAFIPDYFPNYKKYLWIDADAWVNSWFAIELYLKGSDNNKLAISTSADRSYGRVLRADWLIGSYAKIKSQNYKHAKSSGFSEKIARQVALQPHLNIGVFCLNNAAPH